MGKNQNTLSDGIRDSVRSATEHKRTWLSRSPLLAETSDYLDTEMAEDEREFVALVLGVLFWFC